MFVNFPEQAPADGKGEASLDQYCRVVTSVWGFGVEGVEVLSSLTCFRDSNPLFSAAQHKLILPRRNWKKGKLHNPGHTPRFEHIVLIGLEAVL